MSHPCEATTLDQISLSYLVENHPDGQTAARTHGDFFAVAHVAETDLKLVSTWARVGIEEEGRVVGEVLELDLIIERHGIMGMTTKWLNLIEK